MIHHTLYTHDTWKNPSISYLFNTEIIEYDMSEAGFSLIREYDLLPQSVIEKLNTQSKKNRHISIGKIEVRDKILVERKKEAFIKAREMFMTANDLEQDHILAIKKDAIFVTKKCPNQKFGTYIDFRKKNMYSSYVALTRVVDLLYAVGLDTETSKIDVKGIGDDKVALHEGYFLDILKKYFYKIETSETDAVLTFLRRMVDKYKSHEFNELGYYRDFDQRSGYTLLDPDATFDSDEEMLRGIDISVNLKHLIHLMKISL